MEFLPPHEIRAWCDAHGFALTPDDRRLPLPGAASYRFRLPYAEGQRSGREPKVAARCLEELGPWEECLLWVIEWGIWPSGEDWPRYYAARGAREERRSIEEAPGHRFVAGEEADLLEFLTLVLENAWDAAVLPAAGGSRTRAQLAVSHDEFVDVYA
jgi:hypothetical protein